MLRIAVGLLALALASAASADSIDDCTQTEDFNRAISGCTDVANRTDITSETRSIAYSRRGYAYLKLGDHAAAMADLTRAIELDQFNYMAYFDRSGIYRDQGDSQRADEDARNTYGAAQEVCLMYVSPQEGIDACSFIIELEPNSADLYYYRGKTYEEAGDTGSAMADYRKALELKSDYPEPRAALQRLGVTP